MKTEKIALVTGGNKGIGFEIIPNPPRIPLFRLQPPISPRLPVSPSPRLLENKGVIKTDLVLPGNLLHQVFRYF
jgi:hypothetical protein